MTADELATQLKNILGDNLKSIVLYGSAAREDQSRHYSDINILIVLKDIQLPAIKNLGSIFQRWSKEGHPFPLLFSEKSLRESTDVFPIEFLDIQDSHRVLVGTDPFQNLVIPLHNLRTQLEFELRGKSMQLRQKYFETRGKTKSLHDLMARSLSSFSVLFKAVIRLAGQPLPPTRAEIGAALEKIVPVDRDALETIRLLRDRDRAAQKVDVEKLYTRFLSTIEAVVDFVNDFKN